jgi:hypothetical protein
VKDLWLPFDAQIKPEIFPIGDILAVSFLKLPTAAFEVSQSALVTLQATAIVGRRSQRSLRSSNPIALCRRKSHEDDSASRTMPVCHCIVHFILRDEWMS